MTRGCDSGLQAYLDTLKGLAIPLLGRPDRTLPSLSWVRMQAEHLIGNMERTGRLDRETAEDCLTILYDPAPMPVDERLSAICARVLLGQEPKAYRYGPENLTISIPFLSATPKPSKLPNQ